MGIRATKTKRRQTGDKSFAGSKLLSFLREHDREIRDVDAFLHFADAFGMDLAAFQRNQFTQCIDAIPKGIADPADEFPALGSRQTA